MEASHSFYFYLFRIHSIVLFYNVVFQVSPKPLPARIAIRRRAGKGNWVNHFYVNESYVNDLVEAMVKAVSDKNDIKKVRIVLSMAVREHRDRMLDK